MPIVTDEAMLSVLESVFQKLTENQAVSSRDRAHEATGPDRFWHRLKTRFVEIRTKMPGLSEDIVLEMLLGEYREWKRRVQSNDLEFVVPGPSVLPFMSGGLSEHS